jgi:NB-ARC domain
MDPRAIEFDNVLPMLTLWLEKQGNKRIGNPQIAVLRAAWEHIEYSEMSTQTPYNTGYLHRTIAPPLFKLMSEALGEPVNKRTLRKKVLARMSSDPALEPQQPTVQRKVIGLPPLSKLFVGRKEELQELEKHPGHKRCMLVHGTPGIGKTSFISKLFSLAKDDPLSLYECFVWKYVTQDSPKEEINEINQLLELKGEGSFDDFIKKHRLFLCLDGIEKWLHKHRKETEEFLQKITLTEHNSRIILTSREPIEQLDRLMKLGRPVLTLQLQGLQPEDSERILSSYSLEGEWIAKLIQRYEGNPYLLHMLGDKIKNNCGNAEPFLKTKTSIARVAMMPGLNQIFSNNSDLSDCELLILTYLSHYLESDTFTIDGLAEKISTASSYEYSRIVQGIEILKSYSLIKQIDNSEENVLPGYLSRYVKSNPMNLFSIDSFECKVAS